MDEEQSTEYEANESRRQWRPVSREAIEQLLKFREELIQETNGILFEDSAELIRREREKRSEYLMQVISGQYGKDPYDEDTINEQNPTISW